MFPYSVSLEGRRSGFLPKALNYLEVGRLLHIITILSAVLSYFFYSLTRVAIHHEASGATVLFGYLFLHSLTIPFFAQLDARSRYQNYKLVKDLIYQYGFQVRFIKNFRYTKCQREAALHAASDLGYQTNIRKYFSDCGYRWYHMIPDFVWSHPEYLLTKNFWSTTFFAKRYHPKYYLE